MFRRWLWLILAVLALAALAPLATAQEVIWRHPSASTLEKQEGFFRPIMFAEEFARTARLVRTPYTDPDGRAQTSLEVRLPVRALIAQTICEAATRYFRARRLEVGITLVAADSPQSGFALNDPDGRVYSIPRIQVVTDPVYASNDSEALNVVAPVISAVRMGDVENGDNCAVILLRTSSAFLSSSRVPGQYDALVILVDEVIRVPARTVFPPLFPPPAPPAPPAGGGTGTPLPRTPDPVG
ncbi:MAG: hypothetical protein HY462_01720 [Parcubacteria group bacterium]|nr:hypothetical protein [Parcubacteria group bacterium]